MKQYGGLKARLGSLLMGVTIIGAFIGQHMGIEQQAPVRAAHPWLPYATDTYPPMILETGLADHRVTVTTHQICSPNEKPAILHEISAPGVSGTYIFTFGHADSYEEVWTDDRQGAAIIAGNTLTWTSSSHRPTLRLMQIGGECRLTFPLIQLVVFPPFKTYLDRTQQNGMAGNPPPYPTPRK